MPRSDWPVDDAIPLSGAESLGTHVGQPMPQDGEAEDAVLGAMVLSPEAMQDILSEVKPSDFFHQGNQVLFLAMRELFDRGVPVDQVSLADHLRSAGQLEAVGGPARLLELGANTLALANWRHHAQILRRDSILRQIITASANIVSLAFNAPEDTKDVIDRAEKMLLDVTNQDVSSNYVTIEQMMVDLNDLIAELSQRPEDALGVRTGFPGLDSLVLGLQPGQMVVVGARPGVGKTSLALNLATNAAKAGASVALFSLEMSSSEVAQRLLASESAVPLQHIRSGRILDEEWQPLVDHAGMLSNLDIMVDDTPGTTVTEVRAKARRMLKGKENGLIILDYLQLLSTPMGSRYDNRATEVGEMSRGLKIMAKDLGVPVIALSQLNRGLEARKGKRPELSDLRESGSIEQDADIVILLDRSMTDEEAEREDRPDPGMTDFIVAKNRSGPLGTVHANYIPGITKFVELESRYDDMA